MFDIRQFLTRNRIEWRDKGKNCSRNFVNLACPFCGSDPSFHLRVHETDLWYYCLRNPTHRGAKLGWLFRKLKIDFVEPGLALLGSPPNNRVYPKESDSKIGNFSVFTPVTESKESINYLSKRRFDYPEEVATKFNLRFSPTGRWAKRLLIPLTVGWTGRAIVDYVEPRYLAETTDSGFFKYGKGTSAILVEGPIDAIKIASVSSDLLVMAMAGGRVSPAMLSFLISSKTQSIYIVPDMDVVPSHRVYLLGEVRNACVGARVTSPKLPDGYKDCGEMSEVEVRQWIYSI